MRKTRHSVVILLSLALVAGAASSCSWGASREQQPEGPPQEPARIALVREVGEGGAGSFNALAEQGLAEAAEDLEFVTQIYGTESAKDYARTIADATGDGADLVLTVGEWMMVPTSRTAEDHPEATFAGIDQAFRTHQENMVGLVFREHEAAYLAGVVAGLVTLEPDVDARINEGNVVGFIGGVRVPLVERYEAGFTAGVRSVNPTATVLAFYAGSFEDVERGAELASRQIEREADILLIAAGETGLGAMEAAREEGALVIGVETDQSLTIPGASDVVLTSAVKRVDVAVAEVVRRFLEAGLERGRNIEFGLAEKGVGLAPFHRFEQDIPRSVERALDSATEDVVSGAVVVPQSRLELEDEAK